MVWGQWWEYQSGETRGLCSGSRKLESTIPKPQQPCQSQPSPCPTTAGSGRAEAWGREMHRDSSWERPRVVSRPGQSTVSGEGTQGWAVCVLCHGRRRGRAAETPRPCGSLQEWISHSSSQASAAHWLLWFDVPWWLHQPPTPVLCAHTHQFHQCLGPQRTQDLMICGPHSSIWHLDIPWYPEQRELPCSRQFLAMGV